MLDMKLSERSLLALDYTTGKWPENSLIPDGSPDETVKNTELLKDLLVP